MNKYLLVLIGSILLFTSVCQAQEEKINPVQEAVNHSVALFLTGMVGDGTCTGVLIKNTPKEAVVLTAKHCIGTVNEIYVEGILVTEVGINKSHDIAYVKTNEEIPNKTVTHFAKKNPVMKETVIGIGYPLLDLDIAVGQYRVITDKYQILSMVIKPGFSGGGIFNKDAKLCGLMVGMERTLTVAEKLETIYDFINENKLLK